MNALLLPPAIPSPRRTTRLKVGLLALLLGVFPNFCGAAQDLGPAAERTEIRFAYSKAMFIEVNENDAKAAVKVYARALGEQNGVYVNSMPELLAGTNAIAEAIKLKEADLFVLTTEEFLILENQGLEGPLLLASIKDAVTEDYLLLAREDSTLRKLEDLENRSLLVASDPRASLAILWLDLLCRQHGLGPATQVLAKVTSAAKTTQVVLPVFFGKTDACIVTRTGWEVMCELNPQLKKQLRVIAASPPLIPALTCFRRGFADNVKQRILKAVELSATQPAYSQLMALFKTDGLASQPLSSLESTRALVTTYRRLCAGMNGLETVALKTGRPVVETEREGN